MKKYNTDHRRLKKGLLLSTLFLVLGFLTFVGIFKLIGSNTQNVNVNEEELEKNEKTFLDGDNDTQEKPQAPAAPTLNRYYRDSDSHSFGSISGGSGDGYNFSYKNSPNNDGIILTVFHIWNDDGNYDCNVYVDLEIPSTYDSKTVVGIASNFYGWINWTYNDDYYASCYFRYIKLPATLKYIEDNAFINTTRGGARSNTKYDLSACNALVSVGANAFGGDSDRGQIVRINPSQTHLKTIGSKAFKNAWSYYYEQNEAIVTPNLETIGEEAFYGCTGLKLVELAASDYFGTERNSKLKTIGDSAFYGCNIMELITLPKTVTSIGKKAFMNCTMLTTVYMNSDVLNESIFEGCTQLSELSSNDNSIADGEKIFTSVPKRAFYNCQAFVSNSIFKNVEYIDDEAFYHVAFDSFELADDSANGGYTCLRVGEKAFKDCKAIKTLDLKKVQTIENSAFEGCEGLVNLTIPQTLGTNNGTLGTSAFMGCILLEKVTFETDIMNEHMFDGCSKLSDITFNSPTTITTIPAYCFNNCEKLSELSLLKANSTTGELLSNVTSIGESAFNNTSFPEIHITHTVSVGANAFSNMKGLLIVSVNTNDSNNKINISQEMFFHSPTLTTVTIGANVGTVGARAFAQCTSLVNITIQNGIMA